MMHFKDAWRALFGELERERLISWRLYQAVEHTRQYVDVTPDGEPGGLLPNLPGWSHYEARNAFRGARGFIPIPADPLTPEPVEATR